MKRILFHQESECHDKALSFHSFSKSEIVTVTSLIHVGSEQADGGRRQRRPVRGVAAEEGK